jgi:hypothetical protein
MVIVLVKFAMVMHTKFADNSHIKNTWCYYVYFRVHCIHILWIYFISLQRALDYERMTFLNHNLAKAANTLTLTSAEFMVPVGVLLEDV